MADVHLGTLTDGGERPFFGHDALRQLLLAMLACFVAASLATALFLFARGVTGSLVRPIGFTGALATSFMLSLGSWLLRLAIERLAGGKLGRAMLAAAIGATWLVAIALPLSRMDSLAVLALWLPLIAAEAAWWNLGSPFQGTGETPLPPLQLASTGDTPVPPFANAEQSAISNPQSAIHNQQFPGVLQQSTRSWVEGREVVRGFVQATFAAEEQTTAVHLVFTPPLELLPELRLACDDASVGLKTTDCRTYGARIEVRRNVRDTAPRSVVVRYEASA